MQAVNGAQSPGTALDVVGEDAREPSAIDLYLESTRRTKDRIVDELTDLRDSEQGLVGELTRQASEARARCANYQRAIDALSTRGKRTPAPVKAKPAPKGRASAQNQPIADEKVELIRQRAVELLPGSPHRVGDVHAITAGWLAENTDGLSPETARRGLLVLRDREVVRVAGSGKGGGVLYALMPEGSDDD